MEINKENIDKLVQYVNIELKKNSKSSVNKICDKMGVKQSTFKTWVHKAGYSFNIETREYTKVKQLYSQEENKIVDKQTNVIQKDNNSLDIQKLEELIQLLEPLKEVVKEYNRNKNIVEIKPKELNPPAITEVKQKLFKIDVNVLEEWEHFVRKNKQYKVQNLISLAIKEFLDKYK